MIYASAATAPFSDEQLDELLQKSRPRNLAADITGMLLYRDGNFMQTLEGPETAVRTLLEKISRDPRHHHVRIIMDTPIAERSFADWSMGFRKITPENLMNIPGYHDSGDFSLMSRLFMENSARSLNLFLALK